MPVDVKICGITTAATLDASLAARASHLGFNGVTASPRHVTIAQIAALGARAHGRAVRVAVLVEPDDDQVAAVLATGAIDAIQLHGDEVPARCAAIRARGVAIWKAIAVRDATDVARADQWAGAVDRVLFDARTPPGAALTGGMGLRFDWGLLAGYRGGTPWGLSGGLSPDNVSEAIGITGAPLVDVASGVESAPGVKDVDKITAFCQATRA